jgi:hypothetical protein
MHNDVGARPGAFLGVTTTPLTSYDSRENFPFQEVGELLIFA